MGSTKHNYVRARIDEGQVDCGDFDPGYGVEATCEKCGHVASARGTGEASRRCALAKLRESCPCGEKNFYLDATPYP